MSRLEHADRSGPLTRAIIPGRDGAFRVALPANCDGPPPEMTRT